MTKKGRSQICLYGYNSDYSKNIINGSTKRMVDCLAVFPTIRKKYELNKVLVKHRLQLKMIELQRYINASIKNKKEFLNFILFTDSLGKKIDFLVITDFSLNFFVFDAGEVANVFTKKTIVVNSKARNAYQLSNLKVIFKGQDEKGKYVNLIENEVRTTGLPHYRKVPFRSEINQNIYLSFYPT